MTIELQGGFVLAAGNLERGQFAAAGRTAIFLHVQAVLPSHSGDRALTWLRLATVQER